MHIIKDALMVRGKESNIFIALMGEDIFVHFNLWKQVKDFQNILEMRKYWFLVIGKLE